jgi:hypothetical protein
VKFGTLWIILDKIQGKRRNHREKASNEPVCTGLKGVENYNMRAGKHCTPISV